MPIQWDNGILVKIMLRNYGRRVQMNSSMKNVQIYVGISLAICNRVQLTRYAQKCPCLLINFLLKNELFGFQLLKVPNLDMIETIDSIKLADDLNKKWSTISPNDPLKILLQINTSQEEGNVE